MIFSTKEKITHVKGYLPDTTLRAEIIDLLERDDPKKLKRNSNGGYSCPSCGAEFGYNNDIKFCEFCGQRLTSENNGDNKF